MKHLFSDKFILLAGLTLLLFNLGFIYSKTNKKQVSSDIQASNTITTAPNAANVQLRQIFQAGLLYPMLQWNDNQMVVDETDKSYKLKQILGQDNKLIFRFNEFSCNSCIDREISNLKKLAETIGKEHIIILATYNKIRDLAVFKRINKLDIPIYNIPKNIMPTDEVGGTFLFITNAQHQVFMPFLPDKEDADLSLEYFKFIAPLFSKRTE